MLAKRGNGAGGGRGKRLKPNRKKKGSGGDDYQQQSDEEAEKEEEREYPRSLTMIVLAGQRNYHDSGVTDAFNLYTDSVRDKGIEPRKKWAFWWHNVGLPPFR